MWQPWKDELYDTQDVGKCTDYLLEGLAFNRRFAPDVYIGIAPIQSGSQENSQGEIERGQLISHPEKRKLNSTIPYALVMKRLQDKQRLDNQLCHVSKKEQSLEKFIAFLAKNVANMHTQVEYSTLGFGMPDGIAAKLALNRSLYTRTLAQLAGENLIKKEQKEYYIVVIEVLEQACERYSTNFERRYKERHIKRCHGDLKATNLWIRPSYPFFWRKRLLALDCIDFREEFCHIDTLSDVAMLVIDLEMYLTSLLKGKESHYVEHFLNIYMEQAKEYGNVNQTLLEYYMTEKAMVLACISTLYDNRSPLGKQYLDIALKHAQELFKMLESANASSAMSRQRVASQA